MAFTTEQLTKCFAAGVALRLEVQQRPVELDLVAAWRAVLVLLVLVDDDRNFWCAHAGGIRSILLFLRDDGVVAVDLNFVAGAVVS